MVSASHCPTRSRATAGTTPPRLASLVLQHDDVGGRAAGKERPDQLRGHGLVALRTLIALKVISERVCILGPVDFVKNLLSRDGARAAEVTRVLRLP